MLIAITALSLKTYFPIVRLILYSSPLIPSSLIHIKVYNTVQERKWCFPLKEIKYRDQGTIAQK